MCDVLIYSLCELNTYSFHFIRTPQDYEHDLMMSSKYGMLGSVDCNTGDTLVGWDTDQFAMNIRDTTKAMQIVIDQGGLAPGGLNFDCKVRRESTDLEDFLIAHIGGMDAFARGLRNAAKIVEDGVLPGMLKERYATFEQPLGKKVAAGDAKLTELADYAATIGDAPIVSGKQELYEIIHTEYC
jgi:xylose isomerase